MGFSVGDIIKGSGSRAPQFKILKIFPKSLYVVDAYGNTEIKSKKTEWYHVYKKSCVVLG